MNLDKLAKNLHKTSVEKGFWDIMKDATQEQKDIFVTKQLMMIVSEAVEVMEAIRKDKGEEEIARRPKHRALVVRAEGLHRVIGDARDTCDRLHTRYHLTHTEREVDTHALIEGIDKTCAKGIINCNCLAEICYGPIAVCNDT